MCGSQRTTCVSGFSPLITWLARNSDKCLPQLSHTCGCWGGTNKWICSSFLWAIAYNNYLPSLIILNGFRSTPSNLVSQRNPSRWSYDHSAQRYKEGKNENSRTSLSPRRPTSVQFLPFSGLQTFMRLPESKIGFSLVMDAVAFQTPHNIMARLQMSYLVGEAVDQ